MRDLQEPDGLNPPSVNWTVKLHTNVVTSLMTIHSMEGVIIETKRGSLVLRTAVECALIEASPLRIGFYRNI